MEFTEKELMLKTAEALRTLRDERNALLQQQEVQKIALEITNKMIESGRLSSNEVLPKFAEFSGKSKEELTVISKALDLAHSGVFKLGTVSEFNPSQGGSPEDQFKNFLFEDN